MKYKILFAFASAVILALVLWTGFPVQAQMNGPCNMKIIQLVVFEGELLGLDDYGDLYHIDYHHDGRGTNMAERIIVNCPPRVRR